MNNVIEAIILKGKYKGEDVLISNDETVKIVVRLAFAILISKSQGQSLSVCGINLENPCFSHGHLYVACFLIGVLTKIFINAPENKNKNIVYHKALK